MACTSLMRILLTRSLKPFEFLGTYDRRLDYENAEPLGVYVHIPFCRSLCAFCPYCKQLYNKQTAARYTDALLKEIEIVTQTLTEPKEVTSLYFGGGTPALVLDRLGDIIAALKTRFRFTEGIGVELHPDDIDERTLAELKEAGVTMISVGIQSFDARCLRALGRPESHREGLFDTIKAAAFETVDMDLIFAIPGQTTESLTADIAAAFANGATQVSTYPFIDFTFANNRQKPLPESVKKRMLREIQHYCAAQGYVRTSVWTFAKPGTVKYSSVTRDNFLGFGVSATTLLKDCFKINTFSVEQYIARIQSERLPTSLTLRFTPRQRMSYYLFWSAYSMRVSPRAFRRFFGKSLYRCFGAELLFARLLGYIARDSEGFVLTERGAYRYHAVEQAYTTAYIDRMWNISRKIPFPDRIVLK